MEAQAIVEEKPFAAAEEKFREPVARLGDREARRMTHSRLRLEQEGRSWDRPPRLSPLERARIAELRRKGATIREIAVAVSAPRSTVARALVG